MTATESKPESIDLLTALQRDIDHLSRQSTKPTNTAHDALLYANAADSLASVVQKLVHALQASGLTIGVDR
jgi:hypothetical protein